MAALATGSALTTAAGRSGATRVTGSVALLALTRGSDLIATVPERYTGSLREGLFTFTLPVKLAALTISLLWHPRLEADPAHRWLRGLVKEVCRLSFPPFHGGEKPMP